MIQIVTGAAGFIGSHLAGSLVQRGHEVIAFDNLSRGDLRHLALPLSSGRCIFVQTDCANYDSFRAAAQTALAGRKVAALWHLAANSDIPAGVADPRVDLRDTFMTTFNALLLMRVFEIPEFRFASSSAVYGDFGDMEISEDTAPYRPISNYGAMKLAGEAQVSATLETFGQRASVFRFPNVVGAPATHGVIYDLIRKLKADPTVLTVLGNGTQQKAYMHVADLISAMHFIADRAPEKVAIYNIGPLDAGVTVRFIAECVRDALAPAAAIVYGAGNRGWVGDVPRFRYAVGRLATLGWQPSMSSADAIRRSVRDIAAAI